MPGIHIFILDEWQTVPVNTDSDSVLAPNTLSLFQTDRPNFS